MNDKRNYQYDYYSRSVKTLTNMDIRCRSYGLTKEEAEGCAEVVKMVDGIERYYDINLKTQQELINEELHDSYEKTKKSIKLIIFNILIRRKNKKLKIIKKNTILQNRTPRIDKKIIRLETQLSKLTKPFDELGIISPAVLEVKAAAISTEIRIRNSGHCIILK